MRTTPTGQRSTPNNGDDPSTTKKNVDAALDNHPNRPQSATKPAREPSPAATIPRPVSPRTQRSDKPPSGRTGSRKGRKNPLAGPDDDLPPPPPPPPPAASAAELEAEFVQAQAAQVADDEEAEAAAALGAAPTEGEKSDAPSTNANPEDNVNGSVELPAAAKRTIATSVLLGILTLLPLAAVIALAVLQGPLVDQRAMRQGGVMEDLCLTSVSRVAIALQVETRASEDLLVFHVRPNPITTPASVINAANVSTDAFVAARAAYEAAIKATDIQLDALWKQWADTGSSFTGQFTDLGVHAFDDAPAPSATVTTTTVSPWVALREAAASQTRRYDATASPSMSLSRAFDSAALSTVRQYVFAGTPAFRTTPTYAALSRQLPSLCAVALGIEYAPRLGDGSTLASSGALASTLGDHAVRLSSGVATAGDGAIQEASGRVLATWDAIGLRAAARAFPVPLSSVATESMGFQAVLPSAVVDTTSSNLGAQLAQLSPDAVDTIRDQQRQLLGAATALLDSVAKTDKSSVWMTQAVASAVTLWIAVAALALSTLIMVIHSAHEATKRDSYEALDRELRSAEQAMSRMRQTAAKIRCLKLNVVAAFRRRARVARSEETTLYSALSNLRDIESYLPQAITVPPKETPAEALNQDGLNVRPHLHSVRGVAALRIDLSQHHRKFNDADSKKQAVHHHLVRFLATVDEAVHTVVPSGLVTVHGFYVMVWINVNEDVEYPCSAALHVAIEVTDKSMEVFGIVPSIAVVHADLVVGTVGALTATADPAAMQELNAYLGSAASASGTPPSTGNTVQVGDSDAPSAAPLSSDLPQHKAFKAFTTFGPLNEDADMLVAMARLHNVHIVCNQSVARQVYAELKLYNNANAAHYGHHRVEEAGARKHTPGALPALIQFRGLELVANAHVEGDAASIDGETATAPASQATGASMVHSQMGKLDHRVHNSQIILELVRRVTNDKKEGPKVDEWNKLTRYYCNGNLRQAASVLKRWVEIFGSCESAVRMQRLIAVAELVHGPGDASKLSRPFVASYHEIMRDALVEVA